jgi:hypothetical protein
MAHNDGRFVDLETLSKFNKDLVNKEPKSGIRAEFFDEFGGVEALAELLDTNLQTGLSAAEMREVGEGVSLVCC